jgi:hypothetical protein
MARSRWVRSDDTNTSTSPAASDSGRRRGCRTRWPPHDAQAPDEPADYEPPAAIPDHAAGWHRIAQTGSGHDQVFEIRACRRAPTIDRRGAVTDVKAEYFAPSIPATPVATTTAWDTTRCDSGLAVGGVEGHIPKRLVRQRPIPKRRDLDVELGADPAHFRLRNAGVGALTRLSTLRVEVPCRYVTCSMPPGTPTSAVWWTCLFGSGCGRCG